MFYPVGAGWLYFIRLQSANKESTWYYSTKQNFQLDFAHPCSKTLVQTEHSPAQGSQSMTESPRDFSLLAALKHAESLYVASLLLVLIPALSTKGLVTAAGGQVVANMNLFCALAFNVLQF